MKNEVSWFHKYIRDILKRHSDYDGTITNERARNLLGRNYHVPRCHQIQTLNELEKLKLIKRIDKFKIKVF